MRRGYLAVVVDRRLVGCSQKAILRTDRRHWWPVKDGDGAGCVNSGASCPGFRAIPLTLFLAAPTAHDHGAIAAHRFTLQSSK